jgi:hypothetical protein
MNTRVYSLATSAILLMGLSSAVFTETAIAQSATDPNPQPTVSKAGDGGRAVSPPTTADGKAIPAGLVKSSSSATRSRAKLAAANNQAWQVLKHQGSCSNPQSLACANDAFLLATSICSSSAVLFQKGTKGWQIAQYAFVIASAAFTGVGSAATIAGSTTVPKVFSTLGGSTGLAAVNATTNTNIGDNQAGVAAVNALQAGLQKYVQTTGTSPTVADSLTNDLIFLQANSVAGQCVSANGVAPAAPASPAAPSAPSAPAAPAGGGKAGGTHSPQQ